jgi:hypothetical protein
MLRGKEQQSQKVGETALSRSSMYFPFNQSLFAKMDVQIWQCSSEGVSREQGGVYTAECGIVCFLHSS